MNRKYSTRKSIKRLLLPIFMGVMLYANVAYAQGKIEVYHHTSTIAKYQKWLDNTGFSNLYSIYPTEQLSTLKPMNFSLLGQREHILCLINDFSVESEQQFEVNFFQNNGIYVPEKLLLKFAYISNVLPKRVVLIMHNSPCTRIYKGYENGRVQRLWGKCDEFRHQKSTIPVTIERKVNAHTVRSQQSYERLSVKLTAKKVKEFFENYFTIRRDGEFSLLTPLEDDRVWFNVTNLKNEIIRGKDYWETIMVMVDFRKYGGEWIISITTQGGYSGGLGFTPPSRSEFEDMENSEYYVDLDRYTAQLMEELKTYFMKGE